MGACLPRWLLGVASQVCQLQFLLGAFEEAVTQQARPIEHTTKFVAIRCGPDHSLVPVGQGRDQILCRDFSEIEWHVP